MGFGSLFKRHSKQHKSDNQADHANTDPQQSQEELPGYEDSTANRRDVAHDPPKRALSSTDPDVKGQQPSSQQSLPPTNTAPAPSQLPRYRNLNPDPFDPAGPTYGYQYEENAQNFAHPSSVSKEIGKPMKYDDPKAAEIARRASESGQGSTTEMMNYFLRQQELGKKSTDNTIAAWNGV